MPASTTVHAFFTPTTLSVHEAPSYIHVMVSTLLVIAVVAVVAGAVHLIEAVGGLDVREPPRDGEDVLRVDLGDRD